MSGKRKLLRVRAIRVASLLTAIAVLALPASAGAYVYWANNGNGTIGRAGLDGSSVNPSFISGASIPCEMAVDGSHVYWANSPGAGTIGRANLDGSDPEEDFITGGSDTCGVAVDGAHVYWANLGTNTIGRANLDGSKAKQSFITGAHGAHGVAVDGAHVYWTNTETGTIGRANIDGTSKEQSFIPGGTFPCGVAVDGAHIYWANDNGQTIGRANLDGGDPEQAFITGATFPCGVAVDAAHIYWANSANSTSIGRANLDGSDPEQKFITEVSQPSGVAVDSFPHPSATALACSPSRLTLPASASCTATVSDTAAPLSPPTGTVAFSSSGPGALSPTTSCLLVPSAAAASACQLSYVPAAIGSPAIGAAYGGDNTHGSSNGTAQLRASPSNSFALGKLKLNKKDGTATLIATVPGPGKLVLRGGGVRKSAKRAHGRGRVKLAIRPAGRIKRRLVEQGGARVHVKVTYTPTGGAARTKSKALRLLRG